MAGGLQVNMQIAVVVHPHLVVWMHEHRGTPHLNDGGAYELHAGLEEVAIVDIGGLDTLQIGRAHV